MVCPSCGAQIEGPGKFCAVCGKRLPEVEPPPTAAEAAMREPAPDVQPPAQVAYQPPPPPPAPVAYQPPPPPPAPVAYQPPPPPPANPPWGQAPAQSLPPAPQQYGQTYSAYGAPAAYPAPAVRPATGGSPIAGFLALAGGAVAIGSAFLPWITSSYKNALPIEQTDLNDLASGYYLIAAGAIAAVAGLVLLLKLMPGLRPILAIFAIAAGAAILGVEYRAYTHATDTINYMGSGSGLAMGMGLYVGAGGGIGAILGGVLGLVGKG